MAPDFSMPFEPQGWHELANSTL